MPIPSFETPEVTIAADSTPEKAHTPSWRVELIKTLASIAIFSKIASFGAMVEANTNDYDTSSVAPTKSIELAGHKLGADISVGMQDVVPGPARLELPGTRVSFEAASLDQVAAASTNGSEHTKKGTISYVPFVPIMRRKKSD